MRTVPAQAVQAGGRGGLRWHRHAPGHSHNGRIQEPVGRWCHVHVGSAAAWGSLPTLFLPTVELSREAGSMEPGLPAALPLAPRLLAAAWAAGLGGSGLAGHPGSASSWQHQAPGDSGTQPPGLGPAVGCCHPPPQPGHLRPGLLKAQPWEKATEAGMTASTPTAPSARLGVLSTLGTPEGLRRDLSSTHGEAVGATCPRPFSLPGS